MICRPFWWVVVEMRDEEPVRVHVPREMSSVFAAVDLSREVASRRPVRPGPNGPRDSIAPAQIRDLEGGDLRAAVAALAAALRGAS